MENGHFVCTYTKGRQGYALQCVCATCALARWTSGQCPLANLDHSSLTIRFLLCRVFMEVLSFRRLIDDPYPDRPVSKPLPRLPLLRIASQQTLHNLQDLGLHDARAVELV